MLIYNLFSGLAFAVGIVVLALELRRLRLSLWHALPLPVLCFFLARVGAGLLYAFETDSWEATWVSYASPLRGGLSFYGGFYLGALTIAGYGALTRIGAWRCLDLFSAPAAFGYAVGRLGCLFTGCCASALQLPNGWSLPAVFPAPYLFPVQGLDALLALCVGVALLRIPLADRGSRCGWYLLLMGCSRLAVDHLRDTVPVALGLSLIGLLSLPIVGAGLLILLARRRARPRSHAAAHLAGGHSLLT